MIVPVSVVLIEMYYHYHTSGVLQMYDSGYWLEIFGCFPLDSLAEKTVRFCTIIERPGAQPDNLTKIVTCISLDWRCQQLWQLAYAFNLNTSSNW